MNERLWFRTQGERPDLIQALKFCCCLCLTVVFSVAGCSRPAPDPSGGIVNNYTVRVYPDHLNLNNTNAILSDIKKTLQNTGNNYVSVIAKDDVSVGRMYLVLRVCKEHSKVLGVNTFDYELETRQ